MVQEELIEHVVRTIAERFQPERIILFGSHARGEAGPDSDLDLFIEMETSSSPPERAIAIRSAFGIYTWPMDLLVYTPQEVQRLKNVAGTLLSVIEREGKLLYERS